MKEFLKHTGFERHYISIELWRISGLTFYGLSLRVLHNWFLKLYFQNDFSFVLALTVPPSGIYMLTGF